MVTHQEQFLTTVPGPMKEWFDLARHYETLPGVVSISNFPMQPWLDVPEGGWVPVVITDRNPALARRLCADLANKAWSMRDRFMHFDSVTPAEAIRRAAAAERGLIVLSDTGDSVFGGAAGASTVLLREMLRQQITCTALVPMFDPEAAVQLTQAGVGAEVTLDLGGKADTAFFGPARVTGKVAALASGRVTAKVGSNESFDMGRSVLFEAGSIKIVVSEYRGIGGNHPVVYRRFGVEPAQAKMVVLKTASNFQYYGDMTSEVIRVDTPGATMSHMDRFHWQHIQRPIYPLDDIPAWRAVD
jgi:microcystin degradation protein MlrC